jgi:hypothetical protein
MAWHPQLADLRGWIEMPPKLIVRPLLWGVPCCLAASACGDDLYEPHYASSLSEAASFHVAGDTVIPYKEIKDKLKPGFRLEVSAKDKDGKTITTSQGDGALQQVLPTTGYYEQQVIQALSAALAIQLPTTSIANAKTVKQEDGKTVVTIDNSTKYESGKPVTLEDLNKKQADASGRIGALTPLNTGDDAHKLDQGDALLRYRLAAALVQEVALLNDAIDHVESTSKDYPTYIVRLRVAVQPLAPNQPYNAYVALGFFCEDTSKTVKVHPLLVSDDLEATATARTAQTISQLSVAVTGMIGATGFGGLFNSDRNKIRSALGKDLNSTFSISRTGDNTVSIRLGAPRQPTAGYAMIVRNHSVSVVLQAPNGCHKIDLAFAGSLRDANTGAPVPDPLQPVIAEVQFALGRIVEGCIDKREKAAVDARIRQVPIPKLSALLRKTQSNKFADFSEELSKVLSQVGATANDCSKLVAQTAFTKLAEVRSRSPYQTASINLPIGASGSPGSSPIGPTYRRETASTKASTPVPSKPEADAPAQQPPADARPGPTQRKNDQE